MKRSYLRFIALIFLLSAVTIASASRWQGLDEGFSVEYSSTDSIRLRWNASNVNAPYLRYLQRENPSVDELCAACWVAVPRGKRPSLTRVTGFPQNGTVFLGDPHCMRDLWMVPINVQMLTPALAEGNVTTGTITISFAVDTNSPSVLTRGISTVFSPLYHTFVPNFNDVTPNNNIFLPPQILVIAPATLVPTQTNPLTSWINWRKSLGWQVRVATLTEIGGNNVTTIQNWIQNAYNTWQNPPDAVYLVGDDSQIETPLTYTDDPSTIFSSGSGGQPFPGNYSDDNNYVRLDGPMWRTSMPDPLPDMLIGRMLAASVADVSTQGTKTAFYEQLPDTCTWLNRAVVGADQESETQRATKRWTANRMLENGTTYIDSLYTSSSGTNLNELIRTGRSVVNYRG
ncbi:MAG: C25 family cysteine peptidase, partial [bacterium]|nr:C25 family cysteine peptidase [bacterium]